MRRIALMSIVGTLGILAALLSADTGLATPGSGFVGSPPQRATIAPYHFDSNDFKIDQKNPEEVVMRQLAFSPEGTSGWHSHPGPVFVLVTQGTLTNYQADDPTCAGQQITAGQGFVEPPGAVHTVYNRGTVTVLASVTFLDVDPATGTFRFDAARPDNPNCPA
jgi:quercetin dioxygenase-like cupin family protein